MVLMGFERGIAQFGEFLEILFRLSSFDCEPKQAGNSVFVKRLISFFWFFLTSRFWTYLFPKKVSAEEEIRTLERTNRLGPEPSAFNHLATSANFFWKKV